MSKRRKKDKIRNQTSTLRNPDQWLKDCFRGSATSSGVHVNARTAMTYAYVHQAVTLLSNDVAKLDCHLYRTQESGGKKRETSHPSYYLMRFKPCPELTSFDFKRTLVHQALLHGNSYAYIFRDSRLNPTELRLLDPVQTYPVRENTRLLYVTRIGTELRKLDPADVFHLRGLAHDGTCGYSFIELARESVGLGLAAERFGATYFGNGSVGSGVLTFANKQSPETIKEIHRQWNEMHQGIDNAHQIIVAHGGATFEVLRSDPNTAQFLETRAWQRQEMASWFNLPPHKLGDPARTAYASLEISQQDYVDTSLTPWLRAIEWEAWDKLLTEGQKRSGDYTFEFLKEALLKADIKTRYEVYALGITNRIINPNEVRAKENMEPYEGGDEFVAAQGQAPLDSGKPATEEKPVESSTDDAENLTNALRAAVSQDAGKLVRMEQGSIKRLASKSDFSALVEDFYAKHVAKIADDLGPLLGAVAVALGKPLDAKAIATAYCSASRSLVASGVELDEQKQTQALVALVFGESQDGEENDG